MNSCHSTDYEVYLRSTMYKWDKNIYICAPPRPSESPPRPSTAPSLYGASQVAPALQPLRLYRLRKGAALQLVRCALYFYPVTLRAAEAGVIALSDSNNTVVRSKQTIQYYLNIILSDISRMRGAYARSTAHYCITKKLAVSWYPLLPQRK